MNTTKRAPIGTVIVTPEHVGFDGLAAALLAQRVYPSGVVALPAHFDTSAWAFLTLHRDRFRFSRPESVVWDSVGHLVLLGTRRAAALERFDAVLASRLGQDPTFELHVFDNQGAADDDIAGAVEVVAPVGALVTLLVEACRRAGQTLEPADATLAAIGIHESTLSFTASHTTARDVAAYGWLLERGASTRMLNRYLHPLFKPARRFLVGQLVEELEIENIHGIDVGFTVASLARPVDQFVQLTEEVFRLEGISALFALQSARGQVRVAGCSRSPVVHIGRVLGAFGGGGSAVVGSATLDHADVEVLKQELALAVRGSTARPLTVSDMMSSPVRTVGPDLPAQVLRDSLHAWRCTGVPVVDAGAIVGVVSRRDVERAERDLRLRDPVSALMSTNLIVASPTTTLEEALERMTAADIGRLPIVGDGRLVGIVTRTDVLRVLYSRRPLSKPPAPLGNRPEVPRYGESGVVTRSAFMKGSASEP